MIESSLSRRLIRRRRATAQQRAFDGRAELARSIGQLDEVGAGLRTLLENLRRQVRALHRIRHCPESTFSGRVRSRVMAFHTQAFLDDTLRILRDVFSMTQAARTTLTAFQAQGRSGNGARSRAAITLFQTGVARITGEYQEFLQLSPFAANQVFIDGNDNLMERFPPGPDSFAPSAGSAFGVWSGAQGAPDGIHTYAQALMASAQTLARLFADGTLVNGDLHRRRCVFADGSRVEIQAHQPALMHSGRGGAGLAWGVVVGALVGGLAGLVLGGPAIPLMAAMGAATGAAWSCSQFPYDAAWQGYTAEFFAQGGDQRPQATRYFYGWRQSESAASALSLEGGHDPTRFYDFADNAPGFYWQRWWSGNAAPRPVEQVYTVRQPARTQALERQLQALQNLLATDTERAVKVRGDAVVDTRRRARRSTSSKSGRAELASAEILPQGAELQVARRALHADSNRQHAAEVDTLVQSMASAFVVMATPSRRSEVLQAEQPLLLAAAH